MNSQLSSESSNKITATKIIELIKWLISSVVIVIVTTILDNGFKERSAGIQEMQAFDKYVEIILKANNIEDRWKLSEFFSTVTPTDRLRERWVEYKNLIKNDFEEFKKLKAKEIELREEIEKGNSKDAINKLIKVKKQLEPYEQKLAKSTKVDDYTLPKIYTIPQSPQPLSQDAEIYLKKFKDKIKGDLKTDSRYKIDEIFQKSNDLNNNVVYELQKELGEQFSTIQTGYETDFNEARLTNRLGLFLKIDNTKKIFPVFVIKITNDTVIVTMTENDNTETFKTLRNNIDWENMRLFIRNYFLKRLNQLS